MLDMLLFFSFEYYIDYFLCFMVEFKGVWVICVGLYGCDEILYLQNIVVYIWLMFDLMFVIGFQNQFGLIIDFSVEWCG